MRFKRHKSIENDGTNQKFENLKAKLTFGQFSKFPSSFITISNGVIKNYKGKFVIFPLILNLYYGHPCSIWDQLLSSSVLLPLFLYLFFTFWQIDILICTYAYISRSYMSIIKIKWYMFFVYCSHFSVCNWYWD